MRKVSLAVRIYQVIGLTILAVACATWGADAFGIHTAVSAAISSLNPLVVQGFGLVAAAAVVAPFPVDPQLTSIALAYRNNRFIADSILPRKPVGSQNFKYRSYGKGTFMTIPDTTVGRTSAPNRVEIGFTESDSSCLDFGLDDLVPIADINNAPPNYDPRGAATEFLTSLIELDREKRVADLVFAAGTFGSSNKTTLSGTSMWSHASSTPISDIMAALDACVMRPNKLVLGRATASKLFQHASIVKACNGTSGDSGVVRRQQVAELFELDEVIVGEGWYNSAKPGQAPVMARLWGKLAALVYVDPTATSNRGTTFGVTAQWGTRIAGVIEDRDAGLRGGIRVRVGESVRELVLANDLGYLFIDAVA